MCLFSIGCAKEKNESSIVSSGSNTNITGKSEVQTDSQNHENKKWWQDA